MPERYEENLLMMGERPLKGRKRRLGSLCGGCAIVICAIVVLGHASIPNGGRPVISKSLPGLPELMNQKIGQGFPPKAVESQPEEKQPLGGPIHCLGQFLLRAQTE